MARKTAHKKDGTFYGFLTDSISSCCTHGLTRHSADWHVACLHLANTILALQKEVVIIIVVIMIVEKQMPTLDTSHTTKAQEQIEKEINNLIAWLPDPAQLSNDEGRGIIARYSAVLEGNFIYWMSATYLRSVLRRLKREIEENLLEEVKDNHPGMLHGLRWPPMPRRQNWIAAWSIRICRMSGSLW